MADRDPTRLMLRRQQVLADFGEFALRSDDLVAVLTEACRLVGEALATGRAKILEIDPDGRSVLVRAGVGWDPEIVGRLRLLMEERSSESFSIKAGKPVITQDIAKEERFHVPAFMRAAGVVALANVPIFLPGGRPYGLLQVDAGEPRAFAEEDTQFLRTYAAILGPVIDRLLKVRDLSASEERFRLTVEAVRDYAIFLTDVENHITDWLPAAEAVFGWTAGEAIGRPGDILFTPEDRERAESVRELETARAHGTAPNVRWHVRKDGARVFIEGSVTALRDTAGAVRGFLKIGQDVTERRRGEERLRASEARQRALIEGVPQLVWRATRGGVWTWSSPQWSAYTGLSEEESRELGWLAAVHPDDRAAALDAWASAEESEALATEVRLYHRAEARFRWFIVRAVTVRGASTDDAVEWLGTFTDIDDLRRLQEQQAVLVAELQHRTRNLLGVVRSVAQQTIASSDTLEMFQTRFNDRLAALSRVQGLLSRADREPVTLGALVRLELDALGAVVTPGQLAVDGPDVPVGKGMLQTLMLALHELAINAYKYGALSPQGGRLEVTWRTYATTADGERLALEWREEDIRGPDTAGAARRGYGRELIEEALPYALDARTRYELGATALHCSIDLPLAERGGKPGGR